jgi:hypothetical protein
MSLLGALVVPAIAVRELRQLFDTHNCLGLPASAVDPTRTQPILWPARRGRRFCRPTRKRRQ